MPCLVNTGLGDKGVFTQHSSRITPHHLPCSLVLFLISASGLIFEIAVTRLFSFFFQYHYAFLAVALAVLGLSLGVALGQKPGFLAKPGVSFTPLLALTMVFPVVAVGMAQLPWTEAIWPRAILALLPFYFDRFVDGAGFCPVDNFQRSALCG